MCRKKVDTPWSIHRDFTVNKPNPIDVLLFAPQVEARLKTPGHTSASLLKTPQTVKAPATQHATSTKSGVARNLFSASSVRVHPITEIKAKENKSSNNPIDNRKQRLSARVEAKRQSLKQVNSLLKDLVQERAAAASDVKQEPSNPVTGQPPVAKRLLNLTKSSQVVKQNFKVVGKTLTGIIKQLALLNFYKSDFNSTLKLLL